MNKLPPFVAALVYRIGARGFAAALQAATLIIVARVLGPSLFGALVFGQAVGTVLVAVLGFGLPTRALRLLREVDTAALSQRMLNAGFGVSTLATAITFGVSFASSNRHFLVASAAALMVGSDYIVTLLQAVLAGRQKQRQSANLILVHRAVPLTLVVAAYALDASILLPLLGGHLAILILLALRFFRRTGERLRLFELIGESRAYWASSMASSLANLDLPIVRSVLGATAGGLYGASVRLVSPLNIVIGALLTVLVPRVAQESVASKRSALFTRARKYVFALSVCLACVSPLIGVAATWVLGEQYAQSTAITTGVVIGVAISAMSQVYKAELLAEGRARAAAVAIGGGTVAGLLCLVVLALLGGLDWLWMGPILTQTLILAWLAHGQRRRRAH